MTELTEEYVKSLFDYADGKLYWKISPSSRAAIGDVAGRITTRGGYSCTKINKKNYPIHRLIFFWHHGYLPECIDHIDGDRFNNRIENLRMCSRAANAWNTKLRKDNKTGVKGLRYAKIKNYWFWIGTVKAYGHRLTKASKDRDVVIQWLIETRERLHGEYANHGAHQ